MAIKLNYYLLLFISMNYRGEYKLFKRKIGKSKSLRIYDRN